MDPQRKSIRQIWFTTEGVMFSGTWAMDCPYCEKEITDTEDYTTQIQLEDHIHTWHGSDLDPDHPLYRPTKTRKLLGWLDGDPHTSWRDD